MSEHRFFICRHCGNLAGLINDSGVPMVCCGEPMAELTANTVDASREKHLPVVTAAEGGIRIDIGSVAHPMSAEHSIQWVYIRTANGGIRKNFRPGDAPTLTVALGDDKPLAVYAYCNLHGLWKTEL